MCRRSIPFLMFNLLYLLRVTFASHNWGLKVSNSNFPLVLGKYVTTVSSAMAGILCSTRFSYKSRLLWSLCKVPTSVLLRLLLRHSYYASFTSWVLFYRWTCHGSISASLRFRTVVLVLRRAISIGHPDHHYFAPQRNKVVSSSITLNNY